MSVKAGSDFADFAWAYSLWEMRSDRLYHCLLPMHPILIKMKYLIFCMHSGIGPTCPHRFYRMMKNFLECCIDMVLYRFPIGLFLPP
jgi:hypothetical protein